MASKRKYESEFSDDLPAAKSQKLNRNFKDSWKNVFSCLFHVLYMCNMWLCLCPEIRHLPHLAQTVLIWPKQFSFGPCFFNLAHTLARTKNEPEGTLAKDLSFPHVDSKDSDQTGQMPRLICVFAGRTCHFVGLVVRRLKYMCNKMNVISMLSISSFQYRWVRLLGYHCLPIVCPAKTR